jgi:hypothetical protein
LLSGDGHEVTVDVMARPGLRDKVSTLGAGWRDEPIPAPSRAELLSIVADD